MIVGDETDRVLIQRQEARSGGNVNNGFFGERNGTEWNIDLLTIEGKEFIKETTKQLMTAVYIVSCDRFVPSS